MPAKPRPKPTRLVRLRVDLQLTAAEARALEARAAGDSRSVSNLVEWVIAKELARRPRRARKPQDANPRQERRAYHVGPFLTIPERRELEKRAGTERRSLSGYVTRLVLEELGKSEQ